MKIAKTKKGVVKKASDHNAEKIELYNLKNKECQKNFKLLTTNSNLLSSSFNSSDDINTCTNRFIKNLNKCIKQCFKKIRVTDKPNKEIEDYKEVLEAEYGAININVEDGVYTKIEEDVESNKED